MVYPSWLLAQGRTLSMAAVQQPSVDITPLNHGVALLSIAKASWHCAAARGKTSTYEAASLCKATAVGSCAAFWCASKAGSFLSRSVHDTAPFAPTTALSVASHSVLACCAAARSWPGTAITTAKA
eukprot:jgi/Mesvir1/25356/Mv24070-RA.1